MKQRGKPALNGGMSIQNHSSDLLFSEQEHAKAWSLFEDFSQRYLAGVADRPVYPDLDRPALRKIMSAPIPRTGSDFPS